MLFGVTTEDFIPPGHPIRRVRTLVDELLATLSPQLTAMYAPDGRYSVPPEHLIKASLLMALYSIRSERQFCERLQYDLLFKWFLGLNITDPAFDHSTSRRTASGSWNTKWRRPSSVRSSGKRASAG